MARNVFRVWGDADGSDSLLQEVGKENLFTFGVDAADVPRLREERKDFKDYDPRWKEAFKWIYDGKFGDKEYFKVRAHFTLALLGATWA